MKKVFYSLKVFLRKPKILNKLYSFLHKLRSNRIHENILNELFELEKSTEEEISINQSRKLQKTLRYAFENTIYYKEVFINHRVIDGKIFDLKKIPILTKDIIRKNQLQLISKEFHIGYLSKKNTGGSTGEPLVFYTDSKSGLVDNAHHYYLYNLMGYTPNDTIVSCGGFEIDKKTREKNIYWVHNSKNNVFGSLRFSVLYLNDDNISYYVMKILEIKPSILRGYPSFYYTISKFILKNNITIDFQVKGINLTSEMCSPDQREIIERAFSTKVFFEYGHTEVCLFCYTNGHDYTYHSSPIYGYLEVINEDGSDTEIGQVGKIIATSLINHGMPFIRYDTGDLGEVAYRKGGYLKFSRIYGRSQDYIITKDNQKVFLTALIFGQHFQAFARIEKWQIIQNSKGEINFLIIPTNSYDKKDELEIEQKIKNVVEIDIAFDYVDTIPLTSMGKHLFLKQNLKV